MSRPPLAARSSGFLPRLGCVLLQRLAELPLGVLRLGVPSLCALLLAACTDVVPLGEWTRPLLAPVIPTQPDAATPPTFAPPVSVDLPDAAVAPPPPTLTPTGFDASMPVASVPPIQSTPLLDASLPPTLELDAGDAGRPRAPMPVCGAAGDTGHRNTAGAEFGPTETSTDWTWSSSSNSIEWDLMIETDIPHATAASAQGGGYYWAQQFWFTEGVAGIIGLQAEGLYQADPLDTTKIPEVTKMAVFWLSGPPLAAELGDIAYPDARVASQSAAGLSWRTIHARFDWQACHVYTMRFAPELTETSGETWYGAWIVDTTTSVETKLGRMLLPGDAGQLSPFSTSRTSPIKDTADPTRIVTCESAPPASAVFGAPRAVGDTLEHAQHGSRITTPARCGSSRFTEFPDAVRHELAVVVP